MRDLRNYPITYDEIHACLQSLAGSIRDEGRRGDIRPMLLREAAKIVAAQREAEPERFTSSRSQSPSVPPLLSPEERET